MDGEVVAAEVGDGFGEEVVEEADGLGALDGDHRGFEGLIFERKRCLTPFLFGGEVGAEFFAVAGVADHEPVVLAARDDDVVEEAAGFVADEGVHGLAVERPGEIARADEVEEGFSAFAGEFDAAPVRDVEDRCGRGGVLVFLDDLVAALLRLCDDLAGVGLGAFH